MDDRAAPLDTPGGRMDERLEHLADLDPYWRGYRDGLQGRWEALFAPSEGRAEVRWD